MIRLVIAEKLEILSAGLACVLPRELPVRVVGEARDLSSLLSRIDTGGFDLLLLNPTLAGEKTDVIAAIRRSDSQIPILAISPYEDLRHATQALRSGAQGYVTQKCGMKVLLKAVMQVGSGKAFISGAVAEQLALTSYTPQCLARPHTLLTAREWEVFCMLVRGQTPTQIANALNLSVKTISTHKSRLMQRMDMPSISDLVQYAVREKLIGLH